MKTKADWIPEVRDMVERVRADPPSIGVLSMGQQCAVALVLDVEHAWDLPGAKIAPGGKAEHEFDMRPRGYTWLDCVNRVEPELLQACIAVQRELGIN